MYLYHINRIKDSSWYSKFLGPIEIEYHSYKSELSEDICINILDPKSPTTYVRFYLSAVSCCCSSLFLSGVATYKLRQGWAKVAVKFAIRAAEIAGYSTLDCIIPDDNETMIHIVTKLGFKRVPGWSHKNKRTGNNLSYYKFDLSKSPNEYNQFPDVSKFLEEVQ